MLTWNVEHDLSIVSHARSISPEGTVPPLPAQSWSVYFLSIRSSISASWKEQNWLRPLVPVLHLANTTVVPEEPAKLSKTERPQISEPWGKVPLPQSNLCSYSASKLESSQVHNTLMQSSHISGITISHQVVSIWTIHKPNKKCSHKSTGLNVIIWWSYEVPSLADQTRQLGCSYQGRITLQESLTVKTPSQWQWWDRVTTGSVPKKILSVCSMFLLWIRQFHIQVCLEN